MMDRSAKHPVKSYADRRAGVGGDDTPRGITCPRCGGVTMVTTTRRLFGAIRRYRQCAAPNCRFHLVPTEEKA